MGTMGYRLLGVALVAACTSPSSKGIEVVPGPEMRIDEGTTEAVELRFDGEAGGDFELALDESATRLLEATTVTENGVTELRVTPRCSAIPEGSTLVQLTTIEVSKPGTDASMTVGVSIEPNERDACAVQVVGWAGACEDPPTTFPPEIRLDPAIDGAQPICVEVSVPDSIPSLDVEFPEWGSLEPLTISGDDLIGLAPATKTRRQLVATNVLEKFRGRREIDVRWSNGGSARLVVTAGSPGEGVLRIRSTATNVAEYRPSIVKFASSYYEKDGTIACVRATPHAPTTMTLVIRSDLDEVISQGALACGVTINAIELVTAMDSADNESIDVTLERCTPDPTCALTDSACCSRPEALVEIIDTGVLNVPSRSVVEPIAVGLGGERACVDLDRDNVPDVVVRDAQGPRVHAAIGTPTNVRFPAGRSIPAAQSMLALRWFDGLTAQPILVGEFQTAPLLRRANTEGWEAIEWAPRPTSITSAYAWAPVAPARDAGASYLAVKQSDSTIGFACVSPACRGTDAASIDVSTIATGPAQFDNKLSGFAIADFDGDGDFDLVVAVDAIIPVGSPRPVTMYAYDLVWTGHEIIGHGPPMAFTVAGTGVSWSSLQFVTIPTDADGDLIYIATNGAQNNRLVEVAPCGPGCRTSRIIDTIGRVFQIAAVGNKLFAATDLGVWELANGSWVQRDPERARTQTTTIPVPDASSMYGRNLQSCFLADPTLPASMLFDTDAGARWSFAAVVVGTLPVP